MNRAWLLLTLCAVGACSTEPAGVSGTVETRRVVVSAEMAGRVVEAPIEEGQTVTAGQRLIRLDCAAPEAQLAMAEAQQRLAEAQRDLVYEGPRTQEVLAAEAELSAARSQLALSAHGATRAQLDQIDAALDSVTARQTLGQAQLQRAQRLVEIGSGSQADVDAAQANLDALAAERRRLTAQRRDAHHGARREERDILTQRVSQAEARLAALREGARSPELAAADAQVDIARAAAAAAQVAVERCVILAPVSGVVDVIAVEPGEVATPGMSLVAIGREGPFEVRSYVPQYALGHLAVGDAVDVTLDATGETLRGTIHRIGDEAEFTSGNVQTPEDRMLLVFAVDITLPPDAANLRPGMTVVVNVAVSAP